MSRKLHQPDRTVDVYAPGCRFESIRIKTFGTPCATSGRVRLLG
jgi:hypothetical protein